MSHDQEHQADPHANKEGYITGNDYALPYFSKWSSVLRGAELRLLQHVNCDVLSTPGAPPTLLALKQHAQCLCRLIERFEPVNEIVHVNRGPRPDGYHSTRQANAFDWLRDLTQPYTNESPDHHRPLYDLVNQVKASSDVGETVYHCPLEVHEPRQADGVLRPYSSHANLLMHANECLERLDHEYSATGGLLSLLPTDKTHDADGLAAARNSLLGQWLLHTQALVGRMHELEIAYANAADVLAGEAVVPLQHMSTFGPDARSAGREPAFPQDRWILANAGDDVFEHIHALLDRAEALAEQKEHVWRRDRAVLGERLWVEERGGHAYARGIVPVDVTTRYYRLKGQAGPAGARRHPLFVCPAWAHHPATAATRALESRPTVVTVAPPRFPERVSDLERRYMGQEAAVAAATRANQALRAQVRQGDGEMALLKQTLTAETTARRAWEHVGGADQAELVNELDRLRAELTTARNSAADALRNANALRQEVRDRKQEIRDLNTKLQAAQAAPF